MLREDSHEHRDSYERSNRCVLSRQDHRRRTFRSIGFRQQKWFKMTAFALLSLLVLSSISWIDTDASQYRLRNDSKPHYYTLHLVPNIMENTFTGSVIIDFTMMITTSVLTMHQLYLIIDKIEIEGISIKKWNSDDSLQMLTIDCIQHLVRRQTYRIKIDYKGEFYDLKEGFYRSRYFMKNRMRWIATTHFEPTGARLAFPCWDEPIYKAVFNISITCSSNYTTVLSNMPVLNKKYYPDLTATTYFKPSMPMSTYLVAFVVSDYGHKDYDDDRFKIYTKPDSVNKTDLAYNFSLKAMAVMDEYTGIPYFTINPKMDQVTIKDIDSNAMENWGLITYKENYLLYEEGVSSIIDKDHVTSHIAHEFSHQWFGNLVTPIWWEYIWMNEGFARYFEFYIMHKVNSTWRFMDLFPVEVMQGSSFRWDALDARPMNQYVEDPSEIAAIFDFVSYEKGACIIRMISHILTEKVFRTAVKKYLKDNSYSVVDPKNLIGHLQNAAGPDETWGRVHLMKIVDTWIMQPGYPMVTVRKLNSGHYRLTQEQFLYYDVDKFKTWWVPITYATIHKLNFTDTSVTRWMNPRDTSLKIFEPETDWILLNKQQTGYYRVNYDDEIWQKLTEYLKSSNMHRIHPVNRAQLIDDALASARINHTKYETALDLTLYLHHEIDYIPWVTTFRNLDFLSRLLFPSRNYHIFKDYIKYIMHSLTKNVTYVPSPEDDRPTKLLKLNAMKWACLAEVKECLDVAHKEFNAWIEDSSYRLHPDMKDTIVCIGLANATFHVWDVVLKRLFQQRFDSYGNTNPLEILACTNNRTILRPYLIYAGQEDTKIRFDTAVRSVLANPNVAGAEIVQDILEFDLNRISKMQDINSQITSVVIALSYSITDNEGYLRLSKFAIDEQVSSPTAKSVLAQSQRNIRWIAKYGHVIDEWLLKNEELLKSSSTEKMFTSLLLIFSIFNTMLFKMFL